MKEREPKLNLKPVDYLLPFEQSWEASCGPATARIVLRALGKVYPHERGTFITEERIMREMELPMTGTEWHHMEELFSEKLSFPIIKETKATYEELMEEFWKYEFPIIVLWQTDRSRKYNCTLAPAFKAEPGPHFSAIKYIDEEIIFIADPSVGDIFGMTREDFCERWHEEGDERCFLAIRPK